MQFYATQILILFCNLHFAVHRTTNHVLSLIFLHFLFQLVTYAPFTLFPSPVPKDVFLQALAVQIHYNTLVDKISQDPDFLQEALAR